MYSFYVQTMICFILMLVVHPQERIVKGGELVSDKFDKGGPFFFLNLVFSKILKHNFNLKQISE